MSTFQRFSERLAGVEPDDTLFEGVPPHLLYPLQTWLNNDLSANGLTGRIALLLRYQLPTGTNVSRFSYAFALDGEDLLDAVDASLQIDDTRSHTVSAGGTLILKRLLEDAGSAYTVIAASDDMTNDARYRLARRVSDSERDAFTTTLDVASRDRRRASDRLRAAWADVYGRSPQPSDAIGDCIRAVESAAIPVVQPRHNDATLGHVIGELNSNSARWKLAIVDQDGNDSVEPVVAMLKALWRAHRDRHEGVNPAPEVTQEAAEACVHLTVTLVNWFVTGKVVRR